MRKAIEQLLGIVSGSLLAMIFTISRSTSSRGWLAEHTSRDCGRVLRSAARLIPYWPDSDVSKEERSYLMAALKQLAASNPGVMVRAVPRAWLFR